MTLLRSKLLKRNNSRSTKGHNILYKGLGCDIRAFVNFGLSFIKYRVIPFL